MRFLNSGFFTKLLAPDPIKSCSLGRFEFGRICCGDIRLPVISSSMGHNSLWPLTLRSRDTLELRLTGVISTRERNYYFKKISRLCYCLKSNNHQKLPKCNNYYIVFFVFCLTLFLTQVFLIDSPMLKALRGQFQIWITLSKFDQIWQRVPVLWIRIRSDPKLFAGSETGSGSVIINFGSRSYELQFLVTKIA